MRKSWRGAVSTWENGVSLLGDRPVSAVEGRSFLSMQAHLHQGVKKQPDLLSLVRFLNYNYENSPHSFLERGHG